MWASSSTSTKAGLAQQDGVEIHFRQDVALVEEALARDGFEALGQEFGFEAAVGLDDANDHIDAFELSLPRLGQHFIGLADARRGAEKDLQAAGLFLLGLFEQGIRRRPGFGIGFFLSHDRPPQYSEPQLPRRGTPRGRWLPGAKSVKGQVEFQNIHMGFAENPKNAPLNMMLRRVRGQGFRKGRAPWRPAAPGKARLPA